MKLATAIVATVGLVVGLQAAEAPPPMRGTAGGASGPPGPPPAGGGIAALVAIFPPLQPPQRVVENLYLIVGQGGNTLVWIYSNGVLLVDPKLPTNGAKLQAMIRTLTNKPVTHIVLTHMHVDHAGSGGEFPGVEIIAQENTAKRMATMPIYNGKAGMPTRTFKDRLSLFSGDDAVEVRYFGRAHTDGDAVVFVPRAGVMHVGDIMKRKEYPSVDAEHGGSGVDFRRSVAAIRGAGKGMKWVIGGHSDTALTWTDFTDYAQLTRLLYKAERAGAKKGLSATEVLAGFAPPARYKQFNPGTKAGFSGESAVAATLAEIRQRGH